MKYSSYHGNSLTSNNPEVVSSLLQESQGALYEIGVADDGTFVGLGEDELEASLDTLRGMAARLGCNVKVVRKVCVGSVDEREIKRAEAKLADHIKARLRNQKNWKRFSEDTQIKDTDPAEGVDTVIIEKFTIPKLGDKLWVAEAFVKPGDGSGVTLDLHETVKLPEPRRTTEQLRITLTGATTCGKTTLLGTLSTGELDNGRGKSRLSLLRHRHELVSGITSSVAWEIVGYRPEPAGAGALQPPDKNQTSSRVVNYATGNISSWTDIHAYASGGRIAFLSDSAGNPRFIKATFRSLIGWAPHYAAYLVAANNDEATDDGSGIGGPGKHDHAHLALCNQLGLRTLVVITKMDLASKTGLKKVFGSVLTYLKENGKKPVILPQIEKLPDVIRALEADPEHVVPIVFTSSVKGDGIDLLHELIARLPLPDPPRAPVIGRIVERPPDTSSLGFTEKADKVSSEGIRGIDREEEELVSTLFHVEEIYGMQPACNNEDTYGGAVVGGHVRYGKISIGDQFVIGPFPHIDSPGSRSGTPTPTATPTPNSHLSTSGGRMWRQLSKSPDSADERRVGIPRRPRLVMKDEEDDTDGEGGGSEEWEWKVVKVVSVRKLRLSVNTLHAGEAGTLGVVPVAETTTMHPGSSAGFLALGSKLKITLADDDSDGSGGVLSGTPTSFERGGKAVTFANSPPTTPLAPMKLRKGMVILNRPSTKPFPKPHTGFTTALSDPDACSSLAVGSNVMVYIASIRIAARVASVEPPPPPPPPPASATPKKSKGDDALGVFSLDDEFDDGSEEEEHTGEDDVKERMYTFEFNNRAEWIEEGATVLVMPGGGERGLEAFVGKIMSRI